MPKFESFTNTASKTENILKPFTEEEREIIEERIAILTPLCKMISGDLDMEIELNPNEGWHWDFEHNVVRCDPKDLLEKPMDYLRHLFQHEAGHRKVTKAIPPKIVPIEVWNQPGFSYLMNSIEDPRMDSFVMDSVPRYREETKVFFDTQRKMAEEMKSKAEDKAGVKLRFMQAGWEYIEMWFSEKMGEKRDIDPTLPDDVKDVVEKTLPAARKSWNLYPTRQEIEQGVMFGGKLLQGEDLITEYARQSYIINRDEIYPLFKTLIEKDKKDAKEKEKEKQNKGDGDSQNGENNNEKMGDEEIEKMIDELFKILEEELNKLLEGEFQKQEEEASKQGKPFKVGTKSSEKEGQNKQEQDTNSQDLKFTDEQKKKQSELQKKLDEARKKLEQEFNKNQTSYDRILQEMGPVISRLEDQLREIFLERKRSMWESGKRSGARIDVRKEIIGEATGVDALDVFMKRELPLEHDYVISLLVDLSGSMSGENIVETYKAVVVLSEALNNLGIKMAVTGFNDYTFGYKDFDEPYNDDKRKRSERMLHDVVGGTNAAPAVNEVFTKIKKRPEKRKIIFVFTDGQPNDGKTLKYEVIKVEKSEDVQIIGFGLGRDTEFVSSYFKDSIVNVSVHELADKLAQKVRDVIERG